MTARITQDLLRKRAEHNEGMLSTLEEISLHQQDLVRIENFDVYCRHLKILYLQNNLIPKIENVHKLKELEYLNLALNNISKIEGLQQCESLMKLDLTVNFIELQDLKESCENAAKVPNLHELYLTGNPCTSWSFCRQYVVAKIPQLLLLDGTQIAKSERLTAIQNLPALEIGLLDEIEEEKKRKQANPPTQNSYTKESRTKMYEELAEKKAEKNKDDKKEVVKKEPPSVYNERGEIRMMNQGKYEFSLFDDVEKERIRFELKVPKYLDTSDMEVDLNPLYVRIRVRDKYTQIRFSHEIIVEKSTVQRSQANGALVIVCPKLDPDPREREVEIGRKKRLQEAKSKLEEEKKRKEEEEEQAEKKKRQEEYSEYLKEEREKKEKQKKKKEEELVEDDSDIPPLE